MAAFETDLSPKLIRRLEAECRALGISPQRRVIELLEASITPAEYVKPRVVADGLPQLVTFIRALPGVALISNSSSGQHRWWIKFTIDLADEFAWRVIQELGFVLNFISLTELLPTVFKPVSPPPYLNGGPEENLAWVIEATVPFVDPISILAVLQERLPNPPGERASWRNT